MANTKLLIWTENHWIGGVDRFLADLISGLEARPVEIALAGNVHPEFDAWLSARVPEVLPRETLPIASLVSSPLRGLALRLRAPGWRRERLVSGEPATTGSPARDAAIAALRYGQAAVNLKRLRSMLRRRRPDVLLINNGGYPGGESCRVAALAARAAGVPRVLHFVHSQANPPARPVALERRLDRRIDAATDLWITAAERASDALAAQRPIPRDHVRTVHYGLADTSPPVASTDQRRLRSELGFGDEALALTVVAGLEPLKGLGVLLDALAALRDEGVAIRTAIIGDGPLRSALADRAGELDLGHGVCFTGWRDDVDQILGVSDALALPSLSHECLPYAILEAMSHDLPVISTDVGGIPELVVDGVTGRIVAPGDAGALARALRDVATMRDRGRAMGEMGGERLLSQFTLERMIESMATLIGLPG